MIQRSDWSREPFVQEEDLGSTGFSASLESESVIEENDFDVTRGPVRMNIYLQWLFVTEHAS
jgi:hypothetical protein